MLKSFRSTLKYISNVSNKIFVLTIFINLFKQFFNVFYGVYFLRIILYNLQTSSSHSIARLIGVLILMFILNVTFWGIKKYYDNVYLPAFSIKLNEKVNIDISDKIKSISYEEFNQPDILDFSSRLFDNTVKYIEQFINSIGAFIGYLFALIMIAAYVVKIDYFALIISIIPLIVIITVNIITSKLNFELSKNLATSKRKKEYAKRIFYLPQYAKELRVTNISKEIKQQYNDSCNEIINQYKKTGLKIALLKAINVFFSDAFVIIASLVYVMIKVLYGKQLLIGDFVGLTQAITYFTWDLEGIGYTLGEFFECKPHINEFHEFINNIFNKAKKNISYINESDYILHVKNVSYKYKNSEKYALDNIDLKISKGQKIAIVGENGSGKSTLIKIILNLITPIYGNVYLNNININKYDRTSLNDFFATLFQDFTIYPFSIRENIGMGNDISDNIILQELNNIDFGQKVNLDLMYTSEFTENGIQLSGGQKQNLAFLRLAVKQKKFLILDEPTSALDAFAEEKFYKQLYNKFKDDTIIFISHKLCSTSFCDTIVFMENGRIVETGSHDELILKKGRYCLLYNIQKSRYLHQ